MREREIENERGERGNKDKSKIPIAYVACFHLYLKTEKGIKEGHQKGKLIR